MGTQAEDRFRVFEHAVMEPDPWYPAAFTQTKRTHVVETPWYLSYLHTHTVTYRKFLCLRVGIVAHLGSISKTLANLLPPFVLFKNKIIILWLTKLSG